MVIYLSRLPSHSRETADYLATTKSTHHIPIVFVDGELEKVVRVKEKVPNAIYTTEENLKRVLTSLIN